MTRSAAWRSPGAPGTVKGMRSGWKTLTAVAWAVASACAPELEAPADAGPHPPGALRVVVGESAIAPAPEDAPPTRGLLPNVPKERADELVLVDVGLVPLDKGRSPVIEVYVPPETAGLVVFAWAHPGEHAILLEAESPEGEVVVDDEPLRELSEAERGVARGFSAQFFSPNRVVPARQAGAFQIPITPDVALTSGWWILELGAFVVERAGGEVVPIPSSRPLFVAVLARKERPTQGRCDLALHLTGADGLTAETAPDDARLTSALDRVRAIFGEVGIEIGDVHYFDVADPSLRTIVLEEDTCEGGDLDTLLASGAEAAPPGAVPLFLVERFQCVVLGGIDLGQGIGGIAGGIPGAPFVRGTPGAGVAVATGAFLDDPAAFAVLLAHELGHFLGLFHTKENDLFGGAEVYDPISDTPDDARAEDNLMYFSPRAETALTDGQGFVLRTAPWGMP